MADAPFDEYLDTPNKSPRQDVPRRGVCLHHAAMTSLSGLQSLAMGGKQVSATAIAKDRVSKRLMTDGFRAWSLSSAWGDSSFRSVETCNQSTDGWTISDESHWELALLVAYWSIIDGFWPHRDGDPKTWTVVGHREMYTIWDVSYGTACPGGMDLDLVTRRAQAIRNGTAPAGLGMEGIDDMPTPADLWSFEMQNPVTNELMTAGELLRYMAQLVWGYPLVHPDTGTSDTAANFVRYNGRTAELVKQLLARPSAVIDVAKLATELKALGLEVNIDAEGLIAALDASLSDDFAAIPQAVRNEIIAPE